MDNTSDNTANTHDKHGIKFTLELIIFCIIRATD